MSSKRALSAVLILVVAVLVVTVPSDASGAGRRRLPPIAPACGSTISSSGRLTADVGTFSHPCPGNGLEIDTDGVTLDLGGRTIYGLADDSATGIPAGIVVRFQVARVTIKNGTVRHFERGIAALAAGPRLRVLNMVVVGSQQEGLNADGSDMKVIGNTFAGHLRVGLLAVGTRAVVMNNKAFDNDVLGIGAFGSGLVFRNNEAFGNLDGISLGVALTGPNGHERIIGNQSHHNLGFGISVRSAGLTLSRNRTNQNIGNGIESDKDDLTFRSNVADGNGLNGIRADGNNVRFVNNITDTNGYEREDQVGLGISNTGGSNTSSGNVSRGNDDPNECEPVVLIDCFRQTA